MIQTNSVKCKTKGINIMQKILHILKSDQHILIKENINWGLKKLCDEDFNTLKIFLIELFVTSWCGTL